MQCRQRYKQNAFNARKILNRQKLRIRLIALDTATCIEDMDTPGWRLHSLKGDRQGLRAIDVNRNWRIVFEVKDGNAYIVNYEDYH